MKVTEHIKNSKKTVLSLEVLPPLKGQNIKSIFETLDNLIEFEPSFVDVTYHREEYIYKKRPDGLLEKRSVRKRPGTVGICAAIVNKYGIDAIPHIICGGFSKEETENALIDLSFLGIDNVMALRGDAVKSESKFVAEDGGHRYASDLIEQIVQMNNGTYLDEELMNVSSSDFCIGVAGYPEKHFEAPNLSFDLEHLKRKVELGADYIVTQMFFDNQKFFDFTKACKDAGIGIPIIPGIKPLTSANQVITLPRNFHIDIPDELTREMLKCKNKADALQVGIEWGVAQSKELIESGVPCIHYYTMSRSKTIRAILEQVI